MTAARQKEIQELRNGLNSIEEVLIQDALSKISKKGDVSLIADLIALHTRSDDPKIIKSTEEILFGLKASAALDVLMEIATHETNNAHISLALSAMWQSGFSATMHLNQLVLLAIKHDFQVAMEVMTIVENSEFSDEDEDDIDHNLLVLKEEILGKENPNQALLESISTILIDKKISGE